MDRNTRRALRAYRRARWDDEQPTDPQGQVPRRAPAPRSEPLEWLPLAVLAVGVSGVVWRACRGLVDVWGLL